MQRPVKKKEVQKTLCFGCSGEVLPEHQFTATYSRRVFCTHHCFLVNYLKQKPKNDNI